MGNREALLEGAIRCLETRGYAQTTARDLVRESKTNLGAIGYHFASKEALLYEAGAREPWRLSRPAGFLATASAEAAWTATRSSLRQSCTQAQKIRSEIEASLQPLRL